jgi:hypothetical protein
VEAAPRREASLAQSLDDARRRAIRLLVVFAGLVGVANLVVLLAQAPALVRSLVLNADNASTFVLPALAGRAPAGSVVNLGNHPWYEPWWFMRATAGLPDYRQLWEAAPFVLALLGIAVAAACAWWALGRLAGLLCAVALLAASEPVRGIVDVPESHGLIVLHAAVLCLALLFVCGRAQRGRLTPAVLVLVGVPLVVFTGAGLTDELLLVSGLGPFVLAPLLCLLRLRSRVWLTVSAFALATGVLSGLLAVFLAHVMREEHVVHAPFPIVFVGAEAILASVQNLITTLASLGGGDFFGESVGVESVLTFAAGALTLAAIAGILRTLWRWACSTADTSTPASTQVAARELFVAFWGLVLVLTLAVFALTSVSATTGDGRYLIAAWVAIAALLGILATRPVARAVLVLAVALFGVLNVRSEISAGVPPAGVGPDQRLAGAIEHFALAHGARVGYASYWDAAPVTWETHLRVQAYPIQPCSTPTGLCRFYAIQIDTWYSPRPDTSTFLLTDTRSTVPLAVTAPPASLGPPVAQEAVGEGLTVYVYDHDIAADIGV